MINIRSFWQKTRQPTTEREKIYQRGGRNRKKEPITLPKVSILEGNDDEQNTGRAETSGKED